MTVENGGYNSVREPLSPSFKTFMNIVNTCTHLCLGAVAMAAMAMAGSVSNTTSLKQHIYLCVTGYVLLMSQAILAFNSHTGWAQSFSYKNKKTIHWVMQILGSTLAIAGSIVRISSLQYHFQSIHAVLGIVAMVLTIFSLIGGIVNLFSMRLKISPIVMKSVHSCVGSLTFIVALLCLIFGFDTILYRNRLGDINANLGISLTVFALIGTLLSASVGNFRRMWG